MRDLTQQRTTPTGQEAIMNNIATPHIASRYANTGTTTNVARRDGNATRLASEKQVNLIAKLIGEKDLSNYPAEKAAAARRVASGEMEVPSKSASMAITELLALPQKQAAAPVPVSYDVPEGRYAVPSEDGTLRFFKVDRPTEGRWAGRTFVKVQASDDLHPVRGSAAAAVLRAIVAATPQAASLLYGQQIGSCGVCGRTLTDAESRARGIGPICAEKTGW